MVAVALTRARANLHECTPNPAANTNSTPPAHGSTALAGGANRSKFSRDHRDNPTALLHNPIAPLYATPNHKSQPSLSTYTEVSC
jgi:hypothetical protein